MEVRRDPRWVGWVLRVMVRLAKWVWMWMRIDERVKNLWSTVYGCDATMMGQSRVRWDCGSE